MATTPTLIGPVGTRQINSTLYVGLADLPTIQSAVNMAAKIQAVLVVIPANYAGTDLISAVTGVANIEIMDERSYQRQIYVWDTTLLVYRPTRFEQGSGFSSLGVPHIFSPASASFYFDPTGTSGVGTGHIDVYAVSGKGMPSFNLSAIPSDGTPAKTFFRCEVSPVGGVPIAGLPQVEMPSQLGLFNEDFNHYNLWTGEGYIPGGKGMTVWARPTENAIDLQGQTIGGAYDQTIRLNYLGGNVQIGPTISIDAAGDITGINNLGVNELTAGDGTFATCEVAASPVRTFANTPDGPGPGEGMIWPPVGVAVSAGTAWGTSISPATLATYPAAGIPVSTGTAWGTPIAPANVALLNQANTFNGAITVAGGVFPAQIGVSLTGLTTSAATIMAFQPSIGAGLTTGIYLGQSNTPGNCIEYGLIYQGNNNALNRGFIQFPGYPASTQFDLSQNWSFGGGITATTKNFRITHPLDDTKELTHASLEGPEIGVYYRGEAQTVEGVAQVALPDYFEALTLPSQRTVQLTQIFEDENATFSQLAASRVVDGKFTIHSSAASVKVSWEVTAVRADIPELAVVTQKAKDA